MPNTLKDHLEKYEIESELGRDDLTIAYRARRKSDDMPVVVKVVAPQFTFDAYFVRRFKDAVARQIELDHPNIVKTFEVGERQDLLYVVRELVDAEALADYLATNGPLSMSETVALVQQIASALDYGHSKAMRHGNLSDANIFVKDGHVWVTDFGLIQTMEDTSLVKKGFSVGDPVYLSPERVRGDGPSRSADLYALGILTYQMLSGRPPFTGDAAAVLHAQAYEQPEAPHLLNRAVRPAVSEVVLRMLSKGLELRHSTGAEFAHALQVAAEGSASLRPVTRPMPPLELAKSSFNKSFVIWLFVLTPLLGLALAAGFWFISQLVFAPRPAAVPTPAPSPIALQSAFTPPVPTFAPPTFTPAPTLAPDTPTPLPPTATPAPILAAPGEAVIADNSPFSNLILAANKTADNKPEQPGNVFSPTKAPIYLFFDYAAIKPGTSWGMVWQWDELVLEESEDVWPKDYGAYGSAWVFFSPPAGFQPGPYSVALKVEGTPVATIDFLVQP